MALIQAPDQGRKKLLALLSAYESARSPRPQNPPLTSTAKNTRKSPPIAPHQSTEPPRRFAMPPERKVAARSASIELPEPEIKTASAFRPLTQVDAPILQELVHEVSPPPRPQVPLGDFFREYTQLNAAGRTLLWNMPNPKLSVLDDGQGLWFQFVCRLRRPILFYYRGPSETKTLTWNPATNTFTPGGTQSAETWPLRVLNAWLDPDIKDLTAEAARQFGCAGSRVDAVALYTEKDFQVAIGKVAREAERRKVPLLKVTGATLIYSNQPALDLLVVDLKIQQ